MATITGSAVVCVGRLVGCRHGNAHVIASVALRKFLELVSREWSGLALLYDDDDNDVNRRKKNPLAADYLTPLRLHFRSLSVPTIKNCQNTTSLPMVYMPLWVMCVCVCVCVCVCGTREGIYVWYGTLFHLCTVHHPVDTWTIKPLSTSRFFLSRFHRRFISSSQRIQSIQQQQHQQLSI